MPTVSTAAPITCRVEIPPKVFDEFQVIADRENILVEEAIKNRLRACRNHTAKKCLYFQDEQRRRLEKALGRNINDEDHLIRSLEHAMTCSIEGIKITIPARLMDRLKSRHLDRSISFPDFVAKTLTIELERYVGLR